MVLQKVSFGPNDVAFFINRTEYIARKAPRRITLLDLGDLEDLYYAACGKLKDLLGMVNILLSNGFKVLSDPYFTYCSHGYDRTSPVSLSDFKNTLITLETALYDPTMIKTLNEGVLKKNGQLSQNEDESSKNQSSKALYGVIRCQENPGHQFNRNSIRDAKHGVAEPHGLQDMRNVAPGIVFGELSEKYRFIAEKEQLDLQRRNEIKAHQQSTIDKETALPAFTGKGVIEAQNSETSKVCETCICNWECICRKLCEAEPKRHCPCQREDVSDDETCGVDMENLIDTPKARDKQLSTKSNNLVNLMNAACAIPDQPTFDEACISVEEELAVMDEEIVRQHKATQVRQRSPEFSPPSSPRTSSSLSDIEAYTLSASSRTSEHEHIQFWQNPGPERTELHGLLPLDEDCHPLPLFSPSSSDSQSSIQHRLTFARRFVSAGTPPTTDGSRPEVRWTHKLPSIKGTGQVSRAILLAYEPDGARKNIEDEDDKLPNEKSKLTLRNASSSIKRGFRRALQASSRATGTLITSPLKLSGTFKKAEV